MKILEYDKVTFPDVVKRGRRKLMLSQREFSKRVCCKSSILSTIESGSREPSLRQLKNICLTLGFDEVRIDLWRDDE